MIDHIPEGYTSIYRNKENEDELIYVIEVEDKPHLYRCSDGRIISKYLLGKKYHFEYSKYQKNKKVHDVKCLMCGKIHKYQEDVKFKRCSSCNSKASEYAYNMYY